MFDWFEINDKRVGVIYYYSSMVMNFQFNTTFVYTRYLTIKTVVNVLKLKRLIRENRNYS